MLLGEISHPFIIQLKCAFQNKKKLYFGLEYCPGGELFFRLQQVGEFDEDTARFYAAQIILALGHLHEHDVVYRDLKPENVLIGEDGYIKLADFGLSKMHVVSSTDANTFGGTPEYVAPEIIKKKGYGKCIDWWALGCIIYEMVVGLPPFYSKDREKLFKAISKEKPEFPPELSHEGVDFIENLLIKDPKIRLGAGLTGFQDVKDHPWFVNTDWSKVMRKEIEAGFKPNLKCETDTGYIDSKFTEMKAVDSCKKASPLASHKHKGLWEGFSYENKKTGIEDY